jgi:hypothetical protein
MLFNLIVSISQALASPLHLNACVGFFHLFLATGTVAGTGGRQMYWSYLLPHQKSAVVCSAC